ncbi:MAG: hypothetical protein QM758_10195 [Armatimonas sp.]
MIILQSVSGAASLSPAGRKKSLAETQAGIDDCDARLNTLMTEGREAKQELDRARAIVETAQTDARALGALKVRLEGAENQLLRLQERAQTLPGLEKRYQLIERQLTESRYAQDEQKRLVELNTELAALEEVGKQVQDLRREIDSLRGADTEAGAPAGSR